MTTLNSAAMTALEHRVYEALIDICKADYSASIRDIMGATELKSHVVRGVVGSLTKKEWVCSEQEERGGRMFWDIWPRDSTGKVLSFGDWN